MKISLLISGGLGLTILKFIHQFKVISYIATDSKSDEIIEYAKKNNIPCFTGNPRNGKLVNFIKSFDNNQVILSINYLFIIEKDVIDSFKYPINFHGSLLPKYRGRTPHVWAIINNETETGVTAHFIDEGCDTGDIVLQKYISIDSEDTGDSILKKFTDVYPEMVKQVITSIEENKLEPTPQNHSLATYFEKRTPDDGEINWEWQKERIKNWIRAQAHPYPGAFTFLGKNKLTIDKIKYSDFGFNSSVKNGTILAVEPTIIVKTPNGAIELISFREGKENYIENQILGNHENW